jgi:hypothetical protein
MLSVLLLLQGNAASPNLTAVAFGQSSPPWDRQYTGPEASGQQVLGLWQFLPGQETRDSSGKGNELKLRGESRFAPDGKFGKCLECFPADRDNDRPQGAVVKNSPQLSPKGAFTLEMWIRPKPELEKTSLAFLLDKKLLFYESPRPDANCDYCWYLRREGSGKFRMHAMLGFGTASDTYSSETIELRPGQWYHVAFCYDGKGGGRFYLNGQSVGRMTRPGRESITPGKYDLIIGDRVGSIHAGFPGFIDQVRILSGIPEFFAQVTVTLATGSRRVWRRLEPEAALELTVANDFAANLEDTVVELVWPGRLARLEVGKVEAGQNRIVRCPVDTRLRPGTYRLPVVLSGKIVEAGTGKSKAFQTSTQLEIKLVPRPLPEQMPIILWGTGAVEEVKRIGFTHQLISLVDLDRIWRAGKVTSPLPDARLADTLNQLDSWLAVDLAAATSLSPGRWIVQQEELAKKFQRIDRSGNPYSTANICGLFPELQQFAYNTGASVGRAFGFHPALEAVLIHTEVRDQTNLCFHPHDRAAFRRHAGFDIPPEATSKSGVKYASLKNFPADRVIPDNHPLLVFYRWFWKEGDGWNALHSAVHRGIKEFSRPGVWTWFDPAVRAPSIWGSGGQVDVLSHWTYTYPDPIKIGQATDELFAMAEGSSQKVMKMTQIIWYRNQTAPVLPEDPAQRAEWENRIPDARFITIAPDHLREAFWVKISRPIQGIMYHGWGSLVEVDGGSYRYTNAETKEVLAQLIREVVRPLGPSLLAMADPPAEVALLESFTSQMFAGRGTNGWGQSWEADVHLILQWARLQPKIIYEESILRDGLAGCRVLVLPGCDVLPQSVVEKIKAFQKAGGLLIADENLCPALKADYVITIRRRQQKPQEDKAALQEEAEKLRRWLMGKYSWTLDSSEPDLVVRRRVAGKAHYVFVVNDRRTYGNYVGHHRRVMEKGLPLEGTVRLATTGLIIYDLLGHTLVPTTASAHGIQWTVRLGPGEGRVYAALPEEITRVQITGSESGNRGEELRFSAQVVGALGKPIPAVIPVEVQILDPTGTACEGSGFYAAKDGQVAVSYLLAPNDPTGTWKIVVRELASGKETSKNFSVK